ncbi:MAG: 3-oxoacid CoA-transferase subunit A [Pseudomonadota bacterium]|nr:3-oxoacid CoA-transferase subunit A [Pseudomonadota bacterium]
MIDKTIDRINDAVSVIDDGATVLVSGFGDSGNPTELVHALIDQGPRDLTLVNNNAGNGHVGLAALIEAGCVSKMVCSFPRSSHSVVFETMYKKGDIELEVVPQGTLAERLRAAGAGIGGFYTKTTIGTPLAEGKERRHYNGEEYVLEEPMHADFALVKADRADRWGNLTFRLSARNFGPIMCMAAETTIVQAREVVLLGEIPPENVVTPGIFVDQIVEVPNPVNERDLIESDVIYVASKTK